MNKPRIKAGGVWLYYPYQETGASLDLTDQELNALRFCDTWIQGKQEFEFNTSGSTGTPKKIIFKRDQLTRSAQLTIEALRLRPGFKSLVCLDVNFIAGAMMLVRSLVVGMDMIVKTPSGNPLEGIDEPIDFAAFVPLQVDSALSHSRSKLDSIRTVIIGGAALQTHLMEQLQSLRPAFYLTYGMTETITHVALQRLNGPDRQENFELLPGIKASLDPRGCLVIEAPHLGTVVTNDIGNLINATHFQFIGRYDLVINSGGIKVQTEKVEQIVRVVFDKLKISRRFFVAGMPDSKLGEQVTLVLEGSPLSSEEEEKMIDELMPLLGKYEVPRKLCYINTFRETATQKIDRASTLQSLASK